MFNNIWVSWDARPYFQHFYYEAVWSSKSKSVICAMCCTMYAGARLSDTGGIMEVSQQLSLAVAFDQCEATFVWWMAGTKSITSVQTRFILFWYSEDRASCYIFIIKANKMHSFSDLFDRVLYELWTVDPSETCRVLYQINLRNCASCWLLL